uniref:Pectinesterase n=1 Tax=Hyaloperonospora arabidopsidis (strain Emoy2) TaxID=559515 RepID=M4BS89_HYAAE
MKIFVPSAVALISIMTMIVANAITCSGPHARVEPPAGALVVDAAANPKYKNSFRTLAGAVNKLDLSSGNQQTIFILSGLYKEKVTIPFLNGPLVLQGATCDATSYAKNQVTIAQATAQKNLPNDVTNDRNALTSTVLFKSNNVKVYNLNIANTAGNVGQAVAVTVDGENYGFYGCDLRGYQDTLLTKKGKQLYAKSRITGAVDFIFGLEAAVWCERCDIESIGAGCITANGRSSNGSNSYYVFNHARVYGSKGSLVGKTFLGRPWRPYARVVFQNSELSNVVNAAGWSKWNGQSPDHVHFREFKNVGPGAAKRERAAFSQQLTQAVSINQILGDNYKTQSWVDLAYL